jgi:hypothetical protein
MSPVKLAALANRSESWISQVERGARPVDRLGVIAELARVTRAARYLGARVTEPQGSNRHAASMSSTVAIIVNAVLAVVVIVALFRVIWFGISKPYDVPGELRRYDVRRLPPPSKRRAA